MIHHRRCIANFILTSRHIMNSIIHHHTSSTSACITIHGREVHRRVRPTSSYIITNRHNSSWVIVKSHWYIIHFIIHHRTSSFVVHHQISWISRWTIIHRRQFIVDYNIHHHTWSHVVIHHHKSSSVASSNTSYINIHHHISSYIIVILHRRNFATHHHTSSHVVVHHHTSSAIL